MARSSYQKLKLLYIMNFLLQNSDEEHPVTMKQIVEHLEHRAGKDAEGKTGDGVGILLQIGHKFFKKAAEEAGITLGNERDYGIGMFFFPQEELNRNQDKKLFEIICKKEGLNFLGWREVPTCPEILGHKARSCMPSIWQAFVERPARVKPGIDFDRKLYVARRVFEQSSQDTYVCSLSSRTIVYKGMFLVKELRLFYPDLQSEDYESAIGMVHSRFSTNTAPSWNRAHPNRFILHNGEINTIRGNVDTMLAREETIGSNYLKEDMTKVLPIVNQGGSDSAMLDNTLEFLTMSGMDLAQGSVRVVVELKPEIFYQVLSEQTGLEIGDEAGLMPCILELAHAKREYEKVRSALEQVEATGYGIVMPSIGELQLEQPEIVQQGGRYGVRLEACAPSIHMMKATIHTEISPIVGTEKQSEDLVQSLLGDFEADPERLWESNIFGKSLHELVNEGLQNKLLHMPQEARTRLQETLEQVINDGCTGLICILL